ncbi:MAG: recombinase family protein [Chloroflexi bacterium]|nr:recombinase family protein [Chloroflexota bacterium]
MRYVAYIRISSDEQVGNYSVAAQKRAIETWVAAQGSTLTKVYIDEAETGRTSQRPEFQRMRQDARNGKFDALVVHKFDRFARNRTDSLAIKSLLRYDYGVKVFSVTEPSEDSDGPIGALIEGIMESVADWYSRNLATEVSKGKKERGQQGLHNNRPPFGAEKDENQVLIRDAHEYPGLLMAYTEFATGKHSDTDIARMLNQAGYRSKTGRPFSKDTVRDLLQNRTYLGEIKYQEYRRNADGSRSYNAPVQWFAGQHEPLIPRELFDRCQEVRRERASHHQPTKRYNPYLLRNLVYCHPCCSHPPAEKTFANYGKMRCQSQQGGGIRYYRCRARELGYECEQGGVPVETIDDQVISVLMQLKPPDNWRKRITAAMGELLGEQSIEERLGEINGMIDRMDFRWDHGLILDQTEYLQKRLKLQQELESLTPIPEDDLERAADLLANFREHWEACGDDTEAQHKLVKLIVKRAYVRGDEVVAMTLRSDYHIVLGHKLNGPTEVPVDPYVYTSGSDGRRSLSGSILKVLFVSPAEYRKAA